MSIYAIGISYKNASVDTREFVAFDENDKKNIVPTFSKYDFIKGSVIISTCNRTEIYADIDETKYNLAQNCDNNIFLTIFDIVKNFHNLDNNKASLVKEKLSFYKDKEAALHLYKVSSGLDSMILGDGQILGQVKLDYKASLDSYKDHKLSMSVLIHKLFESAFKTAKYIRTNTDIGSHTTSVAYAACLLTREHFQTLSELDAIIVGAGEMSSLIVKYLTKHKPPKLVIANRTLANAEKLKNSLDNHEDIKTISLNEISLYAKDVNIIFTSTNSRSVILDDNTLESIQKARNYRTLLLIDTSVPQNITPNASKIKGVIHYNIDSISNIVLENKAQREKSAELSMTYLEEEASNYLKWAQAKINSTVIESFRSSSLDIKSHLLEEAINDIKNGSNPEEILNSFANKLTNQLIHKPTTWVSHFTQYPEHLKYIKESIKTTGIR
ncbi:MAG: glutamyl-tRNA reductase [Psittacicella sp.]